MSNETRLAAVLEFQYGSIKIVHDAPSRFGDASGPSFVKSNTLAADGVWSAIPLGDVTAPGFYIIENDDTTNNVEIATSASDPPLDSIPPKGISMGYFAAAAPVIRASGGGNALAKYLIVQQ